MSGGLSMMMVIMDEPYLALYVKDLYTRLWGEEVEQLLLYLNCRVPEVLEFISDLWTCEGVQVFKLPLDAPKYEHHGQAFNLMYPHITGNGFVGMDSDNFIYRSGLLSRDAGYIRGGGCDAVGYGCCLTSPPVTAAAKRRWSHGYSGLSPRYFFFRKSVTDQIPHLEFRQEHWKPGDYIAPLDYTVPDPIPGRLKVVGADLAVWVSMQVFALAGPSRIKFIPFEEPGRYHVGALSSVGQYLFRSDDDLRSKRFGSNAILWNHRLFWAFRSKCPLEDFTARYEHHLSRVIPRKPIDLNQPVEQLA